MINYYYKTQFLKSMFARFEVSKERCMFCDIRIKNFKETQFYHILDIYYVEYIYNIIY